MGPRDRNAIKQGFHSIGVFLKLKWLKITVRAITIFSFGGPWHIFCNGVLQANECQFWGPWLVSNIVAARMRVRVPGKHSNPQAVPGPKRFGNHWFKESTGQYKTCYEDTTRESTKAAFRLELCKRHDHIQSQCNDTSQSELASSCLRILSSERASNADRRDQSEASLNAA